MVVKAETVSQEVKNQGHRMRRRSNPKLSEA